MAYAAAPSCVGTRHVTDHMGLTLVSRVTKMCNRVTQMWYNPPPRIIYRKNNLGEEGGGFHQIRVLTTFTYKHYFQYIAYPPFSS